MLVVRRPTIQRSLPNTTPAPQTDTQPNRTGTVLLPFSYMQQQV